MYVQRPPVSKRDLVNRLLSHDFDGDLRNLGKGARISRVSPSVIEIRFDDIDRTFLLSAHVPRGAKSDANGYQQDDFAVVLPPSTRKRGRNQ